jgi:hypothetical protein
MVQTRLEGVIKDVSLASLCSLLSISRLGLLHAQTGSGSAPAAKDLRRAVSDWALVAEKQEISAVKKWELAAHSSLRWLLAANFSGLIDFFLDKSYGSSSSESSIFAQAILDQFIDSSSTSRDARMHPLGVATIHQQFLENLSALERDRLRAERASLRKEDKEFAKAAATRGAPLLFLSMLLLSHSSRFVRYRAARTLLRLGPVTAGYAHGVANTSLLKRYNRLLSVFSAGSRVPLSAFPSTLILQLVQLVSESCSVYAEEVFEECFKRFPALSSSRKLWTIDILCYWSEHLLLLPPSSSPQNAADAAAFMEVDKNSTSLRRLQPAELLEQLFTVVTLELADQSDTQAAVSQLWVRLAQAAEVNLQSIVLFLLSKLHGSGESASVAQILISELFAEHPQQVSSVLVANLNAASYQRPVDGLNLVSHHVRPAVATILAELATRDFSPFLPRLPELWTFCMLHLDTHNEAATALFRTLLQQVKYLLIAQDAKFAKQLIKTNGSLDVLDHALKYHLLRIEWHQEKAAADSQSKWLRSVEDITCMLCQASFLAIRAGPISELSLDDATQQLQWQQLGSLVRHEWCHELLQWGSCRSRDSLDLLQYSSRSVDILRALVVQADASGESAPLSVKPEPAVVATLRSSLLLAMRELSQHVDSTSVASQSASRPQNQLAQSNQTHNLLTARVLGLVDVFLKLAPEVEDEASFLELFWLGVALLQYSRNPGLGSVLFDNGCNLLRALISNRFLRTVGSETHTYQRMLRRARELGYPGLVRMLWKGSWTPPSPNMSPANMLLLHVFGYWKNIASASLWELLGLSEPCILLCTLVACSPMFSAGSNTPSSKEFEVAIMALCTEDSALSSDDRTAISVGLNASDRSSDEFLRKWSMTLFQVFARNPTWLPQCFDTLERMLFEGPRRTAAVVFSIAEVFVKQAESHANLLEPILTYSVRIVSEALLRVGHHTDGGPARQLVETVVAASHDGSAAVVADSVRPFQFFSAAHSLADVIDFLEVTTSSSATPRSKNRNSSKRQGRNKLARQRSTEKGEPKDVRQSKKHERTLSSHPGQANRVEAGAVSPARSMTRSPSTPSAQGKGRRRSASVATANAAQPVLISASSSQRRTDSDDSDSGSDSSSSSLDLDGTLALLSGQDASKLGVLVGTLQRSDWLSSLESTSIAAEDFDSDSSDSSDSDSDSDSADGGAVSLPYLPEFDVEGISLPVLDLGSGDAPGDLFSADSIDLALQGLEQYSSPVPDQDSARDTPSNADLSDSSDSDGSTPRAVSPRNEKSKKSSKSKQKATGSRSTTSSKRKSSPRPPKSNADPSTSLSATTKTPGLRHAPSGKIRVLATAESAAEELNRIVSNSNVRSQFIEFMSKNNYNKDIFFLLEAIYEFKKEQDIGRASSKSKRIMDRYFPRKSALAAVDLPPTLRSETLAAYETVSPATPSAAFFSKVERYAVDQLARGVLPMFVVSDYY